MGDLRTLVGFAAIAFLVEVVIAANITVGSPNGGWDQSTNLQLWASSQTFTVGVNLIFQYSPTHDVLEVTKADYGSCQASNPLQNHNDGNTVIPLTSPGKRYFICGTAGHCSQGMKLEVDTVTPSAPPTSPSTPSPSKSPSPPPKSPPTKAPSPKSPPTKAPSPSPKKVSPSASPSKSPRGGTAATAPASQSPSSAPSDSSDSPTKEASALAPSEANAIFYFSNKVAFALGFGWLMLMGF